MNIDWENASVTATLTGVGWFVHVMWLGPWAERRNLIAAQKREHDLEQWTCMNCHGVHPRWFMDVATGPPPYGDHVEVYCRNCTAKDDHPPRNPYSYEDEAMYVKATKRERRKAAKR